MLGEGSRNVMPGHADPGALDPEPSLTIEPFRSLSELALAARERDAEGYLAACRQMSQLLSSAEARTGGLYLAHLLRGAVLLALGHRPTAIEIRDLGDSVQPMVAASLRIDADAIARTLLTAHDLASDEDLVKGGDFIVFGAATLGALLSEPEADLAALRVSLSKWAAKHQDEIARIASGDDTASAR
jgi:hypothetical protein